jgi:hypothetical protein
VAALHGEIANACGGARLETDEWELESPDELVKIRQKHISTLRLRGKDSSVVYANIWPLGAQVGRWGDEADAVVAAGKLRDILLGCRKKPYWLFSWWSIVLWWTLVAADSILVQVIGGRTAWIIGNALGVVGALGVVNLAWHRSFRGSLVYPRYRRASPSFLRRNADRLIVTGVVSLGTAILTFLLTYYYGPKK